jgi:hypothetical protein
MSEQPALHALSDPFPVVRYRLHCEVVRAIHWPEYEGSALRGLFGHGLRKVACFTGRDECGGCPARSRCTYPAVFEPPAPQGVGRRSGDLTPPYALAPASTSARVLEPGQVYEFDFVLMGPARLSLPTMLLAWRRALSGAIGPVDGAAVLSGLSVFDETGALMPLMTRADLEAGRPVPVHSAATALPASGQVPRAVTVHWRTPVRLKRNSQILNESQLSAADFLSAVARRVTEVSRFHVGRDPAVDHAALRGLAQAVELVRGGLTWTTLRRWSNRQKRHMPLSGITGSMTLTGDLSPFWPLLRLGEVLHVGGKTSFGLGCYRLDTTAREPSEPGMPAAVDNDIETAGA